MGDSRAVSDISTWLICGLAFYLNGTEGIGWGRYADGPGAVMRRQGGPSHATERAAVRPLRLEPRRRRTPRRVTTDEHR